ncbi:hypothetical protein ACFQE7_08735 [Nonomuraea ferruginea]
MATMLTDVTVSEPARVLFASAAQPSDAFTPSGSVRPPSGIGW